MNSFRGPQISAWSGGVCLLLGLTTLAHGSEQAGLLLMGGAILLFVWAALIARAGG
jgi:membrane-bound ClpP family serine protease